MSGTMRNGKFIHYAEYRPRKWKVGMRAIGHRAGDKHGEELGTIVNVYVTINQGHPGYYRNPAYVLLCDSDGRRRSFQYLTAAPKGGADLTVEEAEATMEPDPDESPTLYDTVEERDLDREIDGAKQPKRVGD